MLFPHGYYRTTVAASTLSGPFQGPGQVITTESGPAYNARGKVYNNVTSQPATLAWPGTDTASATTAAQSFNGDLTHVPYAIEHYVSGANTLGSLAQLALTTVNGVNALNSGTINVNTNPSTAGFANPGGSGTATAYLNGVAFTYTGLTSSSFTGCGNHAATTGSETIGANPSPTGYLVVAEASPWLGYLSNSSGRSGTGSNGRTGLGFMNFQLRQESSAGGDLNALWINNCVSGTTSGATRWDQNSSGGLWAGVVYPGANGVYLDPDEIQVRDSLNSFSTSYDVAAAGIIRNFTRNTNTGALGAWWNGSRFQSLGSKAVDVGHMLTGSGGYYIGIDMSSATLTGGAMTLARGQSIFFNASGTDSGGLGFYRYPDSLGSDYIQGTTLSGGRIDTVVAGTRVLQVSSSQVTVNGNFQTASGKAIGFFGASVVSQQGSGIGSNFTANSGTAMNSASTSTGGTGSSAYTFGDVVRALKNLGLFAA